MNTTNNALNPGASLSQVAVSKTLRLKIPQWQGGDNPPSELGAHLLAILAPPSDNPLIAIPVAPYAGHETVIQNGVAHRDAIEQQMRATREVLERHLPDRVVVFGGDCQVDQVPFAYLNERYNGQLGILWIDAHPDIKSPRDYCNAHTMVLANLIGEGDSALAKDVRVHVDPKRVMFAGLREDGLTLQETGFIDRHQIRVAPARSLADSSEPVLAWIRENHIKHLAIHFDLDVLDPAEFRSTFFGEPNPENNPHDAFPAGKMAVQHAVRLIVDVSQSTDVVGLGITEHLPWDAITLRNMMKQIPILS